MTTVPFPHAKPGTRRWAPRFRDLVRGRSGDPAWVRPSVLALALVTFALYVWGLDRNGWANTYYAAAVAAGTRSWKAFFFGSLDAGNFITVDKPPAALWLMELSTRVFGLSSWSMLLPEALAGVACVLLLFSAVRRSFGPVAGLLAAAVMVVTPVTVLMFRFNNPDALLTLLLVASAWSLVRALEAGRAPWLLLSAGILGLAFNTKDLQAFIVLPALVVTYLLFAAGGLRRRLLQLLAAAGVLLLSSGWWLTIVDLIPAASRPYVGGSTDNSVLNLVLGYNGLGRIFGQGARGGGSPNPGGGPGGAGFGGQPGLLRLFNAEIGGQVAWLIPLAAAALAVGLWMHRRRGRTDPARAGYVLWGGWLITHFAVFSFASGIFHPYYTVVLAPAIAALAGAGAVDFWRLRSRSLPGALLVVAVLTGTAWWGRQLLERTPSFAPGLGTVELALVAAASLVIACSRWSQLARAFPTRLPLAALVAAVCALLLGPAAYALATVNHPASGALPLAGPAVSGTRTFAPPGGPASGTTPGAARGGALDAQLIGYLERNQGGSTWLVAVPSGMQAASLELSTGKAVLAMGGFNGSDPVPTASQMTQLVASGKLRFVLLGGRGAGLAGGGPGRILGSGSGPPGGIAPGAGSRPPSTGGPAGAAGRGTQEAVRWVQANCSPVAGAGVSGLYDCAAAPAGS